MPNYKDFDLDIQNDKNNTNNNDVPNSADMRTCGFTCTDSVRRICCRES